MVAKISEMVVKDLRSDDGPHKISPGSDPYDPALVGRVLQPHPMRVTRIVDGLRVEAAPKWRVEMPGVPKDRFTVSVTNGGVMVTGEAPAVSHDSGGRFYSGHVTMRGTPISIPSRRIKIIAKNGVIRLIIPPV